jgi:hypothetical protein
VVLPAAATQTHIIIPKYNSAVIYSINRLYINENPHILFEGPGNDSNDKKINCIQNYQPYIINELIPEFRLTQYNNTKGKLKQVIEIILNDGQSKSPRELVDEIELLIGLNNQFQTNHYKSIMRKINDNTNIYFDILFKLFETNYKNTQKQLSENNFIHKKSIEYKITDDQTLFLPNYDNVYINTKQTEVFHMFPTP